MYIQDPSKPLLDQGFMGALLCRQRKEQRSGFECLNMEKHRAFIAFAMNARQCVTLFYEFYNPYTTVVVL